MTKIIFYLITFTILFVSKLQAQDSSQNGEQANQSFESRAKSIAFKIEQITKEEKAALKAEVEAVNQQLEKGLITAKEADEQKIQFAETRAKNIETRVNLAQDDLRALVQEKVDGKIAESDSTRKIVIHWNSKRNTKKKFAVERRTTSQFVFATGLNNLATDGKVEKSDFRFLGSHFYEWGFTSNTRIAKNNNLLHFKYGFSVMYNNLRPTDDRVFVVSGNQTNLQASAINSDDSRFRNVYLVAPVHFEFDFSEKKTNGDKSYFQTHKSVRIGFGGYAGINLKSKQFIKYDNDDLKTNVKTKGDFNTNNFIYGLSTYIGYEQTSLYLKYDLNPLFKDNAIKQNNVSLGIRFDFN